GAEVARRRRLGGTATVGAPEERAEVVRERRQVVAGDAGEIEPVLLRREAAAEERKPDELGGAEAPRRLRETLAHPVDDALRRRHRRKRADRGARRLLALLLQVEDPAAVHAALAGDEDGDAQDAEAAGAGDAVGGVDDLELVRRVLEAVGDAV